MLDTLKDAQRKAETDQQQPADNGDNAGRHETDVECMIVNREAGCGKDQTSHTQHCPKRK